MSARTLRIAFWASVVGFVAAFVLLVLSTTAGNPNTVAYPTWDFSTAKQTVLVAVAGALAVVSTVVLATYYLLRSRRRAGR